MSSHKNQRGFSLLEVMVTAALLGGLALAGSKLMVDQNKSMKSIEGKAEINALLSDIRSILSDSASCQATFINQDSKNLPPNIIRNILQATPTGNVSRLESNLDWRIGRAYGNGNVRIISFALSDSNPDPGIEVTPSPGIPVTGVTELLVTLSLGEKKVYGSDTVLKKIRLNVTTQPSTSLIQSCSSAVSDNSLNDATLACTALAGTYDASTEKCILSPYPSPITPYTAVSNQYLNGWMVGILDERYVNTIGDEMTGNLTFAGSAGISLDTGAINFTSDRKLKKDITELKDSLESLRKIRPVSYRWKSNNKKHYGVIAQELAKIYPDLVKVVGPDDTLGVEYIQLIPVLIKGINEVDEENRLLKKSLKKTNQELLMLKKYLCRPDPKQDFCNEGKR